MRTVALLCSLTLLLAGCQARQPNETNFKKAIGAYIAKHGRECIALSHSLPFDITADQTVADPGPAALEQVGLLHSAPVTLQSDQGTPLAARRYYITEFGRLYLGETQNSVLVGNRTNFCYAQVTVQTVTGWSQPTSEDGVTTTAVRYTYQLGNLAPWAKQPVILKTFPFLKNEIEEAGHKERQLDLTLSGAGWHAE